MAVFEYTAAKFDGTVVKGQKEAFDLGDLKTKLRLENLFLREAKELKIKKKSTFFSFSSKIKTDKVVLFMRQLAILINAGVSLKDSIKALYQQETHATFKNILQEIQKDLIQGVMLSESISKYPKVFPSYFKNMIYVSEVSGRLSEVLNLLAEYYENEQRSRAKAKKALMYPTFLFVIILIVFVFLVSFVVPQLHALLVQFDGDLPLVTEIIINISNFFRTQYPAIILGGSAIGLFVYLFLKTKPGKFTRDYIKLNVPILRNVNKDLITTRFARSLAILISSGVSVMDSIEITGKLMDNVIFEKKFIQVIDFVKKGKRIASSVRTIEFFPVMFVEMIAVGEQTGELDSVLNKVSEYFDEKLTQTIATATTLLEPLLIIFAAGIVGFVILAIFLPLIAIMGSI